MNKLCHKSMTGISMRLLGSFVLVMSVYGSVNVAPGFAAEGNPVVFYYTAESGTSTVWKVDAGFTTNPRKICQVEWNILALFPSPDGRQLALTCNSFKNAEVCEIQLYDLTVGKFRRFPGRSAFFLCWIAGGRSFLYTKFISGMCHLFRADSASFHEKRIDAFRDIKIYSAAPAPTGSMLAICGTEHGAPGQITIFLYDYLSETVSKLSLEGQNCVFPAWSPDAKQLVFVGQNDDEAKLFVTGLPPQDLEPVYKAEAIFSPGFSPDGAFIAFSLRRECRYRLGTIASANGDFSMLTPAALNSLKPVFADDSRILFQGEDAQGMSGLYTCDVERKKVFKLALKAATPLGPVPGLYNPGRPGGNNSVTIQFMVGVAGLAIIALIFILRTVWTPGMIIEFTLDDGRKLSCSITRQKTRIGRTDDNDIILQDRSLSRSHAQILRRGKKFFVKDLASTLGTVLRTTKLQSGELRQLSRGDTGCFGNVRFEIK